MRKSLKDTKNVEKEEGANTDIKKKKGLNVPQIISLVLFVLLIAGSVLFVLLIINQIGWDRLSGDYGKEAIQEYISQFGVWKSFVYIGLQFLAVLFAFIPNNILGIVGGMLFKMWPSVIYTVIGIMLGCIAVFWIARALGRPIVEQLTDKDKLAKLEKKLANKDNILFAVLMLIPFIPSDIICYVAGLTKMRFRDYMFIIITTRPWGIILSAYMGSGSVKWWQWLIIFAALGVVLFFIIKYGNRIASTLRKRKIWAPIADMFDEMGDLSVSLKINPDRSLNVQQDLVMSAESTEELKKEDFVAGEDKEQDNNIVL